MAVCVRSKRVTDPLDDRVKTSLCNWVCQKRGYESSGSEHEADSACLADLVHGFIEEDDSRILSQETTLDSGQNEFPTEEVLEILNKLVNCDVNDPFKFKLRTLVLHAVETFSGVVSNRAVFRRAVMKRLRDSGYNAGICKSKWESSGGLTAGNYEYIDVVITEGSRETRYLVDVDFSGVFQIARPTSQYAQILQNLPRIFVGKPDELKQIIRAICESAKKSLKVRELHLPPWRKNRYMQAKWLGPYRRTVDPFPPSGKPLSPKSNVIVVVKSRLIGFEAYHVNMDVV